MQPFKLRNLILPMYLGLVLLLITPLSTLTALYIILPLVLIGISFSQRKRNLGVIGMALFYLVSIPQYLITTIDDPVHVYLLTSVIIIPSMFLLYQVLTNQPIHHIVSEISIQKKAILLTIFFGVLTFVSVYLISFFIGDATLFNTENIQGQILLLAAVSFLIFTPLLLRKTKGIMEE